MSDKNIDGLSIKGLPDKISNNTRGPVRTDEYGNVFNVPIGNFRHSIAAQGSYFIAHNPTNDASTTLVGHAAPVLADADATLTKPIVFMRNESPASEGKWCYLDFIEIEVVTAGATGSSANWAAQIDTGTTRVTTAGVAFTRANPNMQSTASPSLAVQGGVVVVGAETASCRDLGFGQIRAAIEFAGDRTTFRFGGSATSGANVVSGAASRHLVNLPPVVLGATDAFLLAIYAPAQNAAGIYKVRCGWWEL